MRHVQLLIPHLVRTFAPMFPVPVVDPTLPEKGPWLQTGYKLVSPMGETKQKRTVFDPRSVEQGWLIQAITVSSLALK